MATWTDYYTDNERDGGHLEYLFDKSQQDLADLCVGHLDDAESLALTISTSGGANVILLPGTKGEVIVLHQGFTTSTHLGGDLLLVFVNGNLSESPFKVLNPTVATREIQSLQTLRTTDRAKGCPLPASMFNATSEAEFLALVPEGNTELEGRPNHLFLHPR